MVQKLQKNCEFQHDFFMFLSRTSGLDIVNFITFWNDEHKQMKERMSAQRDYQDLGMYHYQNQNQN